MAILIPRGKMIRLTDTRWIAEPIGPIILARDVKPGDEVHYGRVILYVDADRRLHTPGGIEWACEDELLMTDLDSRCGVAPLTVENTPIDYACKNHDFKYSSAVYQEHHTREEADNDLERDAKLLAPNQKWKEIGKAFAELARTYGSTFWENAKTKARRFKV